MLGGNGFVGTAVCKAAVRKNISVVSLSRSGRPKTQAPWADQVSWVAGKPPSSILRSGCAHKHLKIFTTVTLKRAFVVIIRWFLSLEWTLFCTNIQACARGRISIERFFEVDGYNCRYVTLRGIGTDF